MKKSRILLTFLFAALLSAWSCKHEQRDPKIDFEGDSSWYHDTAQERDYLVRTFPPAPPEGKKTIPWPPEELARYVDISIDVTQSSFNYQMIYRGKQIPWAEYNANRFADYLVDEHVLLPGDRITLRVFGSDPAQRKNQKLSQDQSWNLINPPLQIDVEYQVYTARFNDRHLKIAKITGSDPEYLRGTARQIRDWALAEIRQQIYTKSPLLEHIAAVKRNTDSKSGKRLLIFVTDGHIDFAGVYFCPTTYSDQILDKIRNGVDQLRLKPFIEPDARVSMILFGLNDGGNEQFRQKQDALLRWYFASQDPRFVTFVRN